MNKERAKELLPVMEAFANGETIQWKTDFVDESEPDELNDDDDFDPTLSLEYRIKPKPREWLLCWEDDGSSESYRFSGDSSESALNHWANYIKVREVLE